MENHPPKPRRRRVERAKVAGQPERFAQLALGHNSKAVHRAYQIVRGRYPDRDIPGDE